MWTSRTTNQKYKVDSAKLEKFMAEEIILKRKMNKETIYIQTKKEFGVWVRT